MFFHMLRTVRPITVLTLRQRHFTATSFELATVPRNYDHPSTSSFVSRLAKRPDGSVRIADHGSRSLCIEVESGKDAGENNHGNQWKHVTEAYSDKDEDRAKKSHNRDDRQERTAKPSLLSSQV